MQKRALVGLSLVFAAACGRQDLVPVRVEELRTSVPQVTVPVLKRGAELPQEVLTVAPPHVEVTVRDAAAGTVLHLIAGQFGCGFSKLGEATVTLQSGDNHVRIPLQNYEDEPWTSVTGFIDANGDGACTETELYAADETGTLALNGEDAWMCGLFARENQP